MMKNFNRNANTVLLMSSLYCLLAQFTFSYISISMISKAIQKSKTLIKENDGNNNFDGKEFEDALKSMGPVWGKKANTADESVFKAIRDDQIAKAEQIYREYPFESIELPILPDCNNYYSGQFGDFFWHQNADQVYVYIPVEDSVNKKDVDVKFEARKVTVQVNNEEIISFQCLERIIPDGSFWVLERDNAGLFGDGNEEDLKKIENRSKMMEKLFAANKGMSKLTGVPPETMTEMMKNGDLAKMLADEIYEKPSIQSEVINEDGTTFFGDEVEVEEEESILNIDELDILTNNDKVIDSE